MLVTTHEGRKDIPFGAYYNYQNDGEPNSIYSEMVLSGQETYHGHPKHKGWVIDELHRRLWHTVPLYVPSDKRFKAVWQLDEKYIGNKNQILHERQVRDWIESGNPVELRIRLTLIFATEQTETTPLALRAQASIQALRRFETDKTGDFALHVSPLVALLEEFIEKERFCLNQSS